FRGIRPAFGYPACPDHREKGRLFDLLDAPAVGITLTEQFSMMPAASVSGLYFAHPASRYFGIGRIGRDQLERYAERRGDPADEPARWRAPTLGCPTAEPRPSACCDRPVPEPGHRSPEGFLEGHGRLPSQQLPGPGDVRLALGGIVHRPFHEPDVGL